jgi:invasion protein IalB
MVRKFLFAFTLLLSLPALAAEGAFDSTHKAWNVFTGGKGKEKLCYITSTPTKQKGTFSHRGDPYVLVTMRMDKSVEVSVSSGYPYKTGSAVEASVAKVKNFKLFTSDETPKIAWARSGDDDKKLVAALKKGKEFTVKGASQKDTASTDTYSLSGFGDAYKRMAQLCK